MANQPARTSGLYVPLLLARKYPELFEDAGCIYLDMWPIASPMLAVYHPDLMAQYTQVTSLPKHGQMKMEFTPFTGCNDLVTQEGKDWKTWRSVFNPGFSAKNILSFVPEIVEEILIFKDWLTDVAKKGEVRKLDAQAAKITVDVMGRVVL
jgi:cytochrome P450